MPKRRRGADGALREATLREAKEAALARAAAAGAAPQEESEEELIDLSDADAVPTDVGNGAARAAKTIEAWADDETKVSRWLETRGGEPETRLTELSGGMVRLRDFFPRDIADSALAIMESLPEDAWEISEATAVDAAKHRFWSTDLTDVPALLPLRAVFWRLFKTFRGEPTMPIFSCGRYGASDFIGRHDDRAHVPFFSDDNIFSRTVAGIWYLTREWSAEEGGGLLDLQAPGAAPSDEPVDTLVPIYNSMVAFEVPHMHAVGPVKAERYRYSIFGWWHQKGKRYELPVSESVAHAGKPGRKKRKKVGRHKPKEGPAATSSPQDD